MEHKDLTKEAPRSAKEILGGYAIMARMIDKCRATIAGTNGDYHFNCPLDVMIFSFKNADAEIFKTKVATGATDEELVAYFNELGDPKTDEEVASWSEEVLHTDYHNHPDVEKKAWFDGECERLELDPSSTYVFDYLDVDDKATFA